MLMSFGHSVGLAWPVDHYLEGVRFQEMASQEVKIVSKVARVRLKSTKSSFIPKQWLAFPRNQTTCRKIREIWK